MVTLGSIKDAFYECYVVEFGLGYETVEVTEYRLIKHYWNKVSDRLKTKHAELRTLGENLGKQQIASIMSKPNLFLAMIPKSNLNNTGAGYFGPIKDYGTDETGGA